MNIRSFAAAFVLALVPAAADAATFCIPASLKYTWVNMGCGVGCSLPRMSLSTSGQWSCGQANAPAGKRFSFPAGGKRYFCSQRGGSYYCS